ncbi:hypothetical protein RRG08_020339 [Elysia crispata]|uniref:Uncharacterized protein n=1 Tax=Elysia crispata TaxID=231223 RepID=A0AAE1DX14_9GAST|nr:hypothetical protein RRG08_020339 [Elysia crispata]
MPRPPGGILRGVPTPEPRSTTSATEASQAEGQAGDQPAAGAPPSPNLRRRTVPRMLPQPPPVNDTVETHEAAPGENGHASVAVGHSHSNGTSSGVNAGTGTGAAESNCESGPAGAEGSSSCHGGEAAGPHVSDDGA